MGRNFDVEWTDEVVGVEGASQGQFVVTNGEAFLPAVAANLALYPAVMGMVKEPFVGETALLQDGGNVFPEIHGMTETANGFARLNTTTGFAEWVAAYVDGDVRLGTMNAGVLRLELGGGSSGGVTPDPPLLAAYWVDGQNVSGLASDANTGESALLPLRTGRHLSLLLGTKFLTQNTIVHVMSDMQTGDDWSLFCSCEEYTLTFVGTRTSVASGTFTAASGPTPPSPAQVTDSSKDPAFWAPYATAGYHVEDTTANAVFPVWRDLGSATADVGAPCVKVSAVSLVDTTPTLAAIAPGDAYIVYKLPKIAMSKLGTGLNYNLLYQDLELESQPVFGNASFLQVPCDSFIASQCGLSGDTGFAAWTGIASQFIVNCRTTTDLILGIGYVYAGAHDGHEVVGTSPGFQVDFHAVLANDVLMPWNGILQMGTVYLDGDADSSAWPGGPIIGYGGRCGITVKDFQGNTGRVYGPGKIRVHAGDSLLYTGSAVAVFEQAGGLEVEGGVEAFAQYDDGTWTALRVVTPANLDASLASGGFNGAARTNKGTLLCNADTNNGANPAPGSGASTDFLIDADFTVKQSAYSGVSFARASGVLYAQTSTVDAELVGLTAPIWEDRGDGYGGGVWVFAAYDNEVLSPTDLTAVDWTPQGSPTIAHLAGRDPTGGTLADSIEDANAGAFVLAYQLKSNANRWSSVWAESVTPLPTAPGMLVVDTGVVGGVSLGQRQAWRRYPALAAVSNDYAICPAGAQPGPILDPAATGKLLVWGMSRTPRAILPFATSSVADEIGRVDATKIVDADGGFRIKADFRYEYLDSITNNSDLCLFSMTSTDGETSVRFLSGNSISVRMKGVDVFTMGVYEAGPTTARRNDIIGFELWGLPDGNIGIITNVNGTRCERALFYVAGAFAVPTAAYLGSRLGASEFFDARVLSFKSWRVARAPELAPDVVVLGDSTVSQRENHIPTSSDYFTEPERFEKSLVNLAVPGATIASQLALATALLDAHPEAAASTKKVIVQIGINNCTDVSVSGDLITAYQALMTFLKAGFPLASIYAATMTPCFAYYQTAYPGDAGANAQACWEALNQAKIDGTITGIQGYMRAHTVALDDGSGNLIGGGVGDGVHLTNAQKTVCALSWRNPVPLSIAGSPVTLLGDVTGPSSASVVERLHGATIPVAGALTPGNGIVVSGASSLVYGPLNLAGGAAYVSGTLPVGNLPSLAGDVTGPINTSKVEKLTGDVGGIVGGTANAIQLGASPAASGALRLSHNTGVVAKNGGGVDVPLIALNSSAIELGSTAYGANHNYYSNANENHFCNNGSSWSSVSTHISGTAGPNLRGVSNFPFQISVDTRASDAETVLLHILSQAPFATATGANKTPGALLLEVPAPISGGSPGLIRSRNNGVDITEIQSDAFALKKGLRRHVRVVTATGDLAPTDDFVLVSGHSANVTLNLNPMLTTYQADGVEVTVFNDSVDKTVTLDGGSVNIHRSGSTATTYVLSFRESARLIYSDTIGKWYVVTDQP